MKEIEDRLILFSMQDLFGYLRAHPTMSGIQRVQAGIALYAIEHEGAKVGFLLNDLTEKHRDGEFLLVDNGALRAIIDYASGERVDHQRLREMLDKCERAAARFYPRPDDTIILLGAFWGHGNTIDRYVAARRTGVKIGGYVYDIIPITHPEYCDAGLSRDFAMSFGEFAMVVDFIFTISDYTGETVARLLRENGGRDIPIRTVPLAHSLTVPHDAADSWPAALRKIRGRPYVAYVSTVEGRKNHAYVVNAWQQMIADGVDVPDLVFVGRKGWRINGLMDLLEGTRYLGGRVHIVHDLSDAELASVYDNCLFTVFTSFVEGWGLPVGESLMHGVPCAASSTSSIPEVGGEFVDYLDPLNVRNGIEILRRLIEDEAYREGRRAMIRESFVPRTWDDVGRDFIAKTKQAVAADYPMPDIAPRLREGHCMRIGTLVTDPIVMRDYLPSPIRLALVESFYAVEWHGAWMRGKIGTLPFLTDCAEGEDIIVYVELTFAHDTGGPEVSVQIENAASTQTARASTRKLETGRRNLIRARGRVGANGSCTLLLETSGPFVRNGNDTRNYAIGLAAIGYARVSEAQLREELVEQFLFYDLSSGA